jgi:hypothetical protein
MVRPEEYFLFSKLMTLAKLPVLCVILGAFIFEQFIVILLLVI